VLRRRQWGDEVTEKISDVPRPIGTIATVIVSDWQNVSPAAVPYVTAMLMLESLDDRYGHDGADDIVMRFLTNATDWRGDVARAVKAELRAMLRAHTAASHAQHVRLPKCTFKAQVASTHGYNEVMFRIINNADASIIEALSQIDDDTVVTVTIKA
jgi:hypothetical protein